jgi:hypothetical protein
LQFASFGIVSFRGDLHPQDDVPAGRTRSAASAQAPFNGMLSSGRLVGLGVDWG